MLAYGFSPDSMLVGTMVSIQKDKRQLVCISDLFIAITLGTFVAKLFDAAILSKEQHKLAIFHFQFFNVKYLRYFMSYYYNATCSNI